ncbi:MAG: cell wall hydrolase [Deltaproteobacteria bacterium]|nr:cell wall hydrolase [Deltaproteobacteria bacterium]
MDELKILDDIDLLTALIMGESEAEPVLGKIAVACVVKNRLADPRWPDDWKGVMLQKWQFSCFLPACFRPEILKHSWTPAWKECKFAAFGVYHDYVRDVTEGANLYWNPGIIKKPNWDWSKVTLLDKIGKHQFARE